MDSYGSGSSETVNASSRVSARVHDPDGNEHKVWFIRVDDRWELE